MLATVLGRIVRVYEQFLGCGFNTCGYELGTYRGNSEDCARNLELSAPVQDGFRPSSVVPDLRT